MKFKDLNQLPQLSFQTKDQYVKVITPNPYGRSITYDKVYKIVCWVPESDLMDIGRTTCIGRAFYIINELGKKDKFYLTDNWFKLITP